MPLWPAGETLVSLAGVLQTKKMNKHDEIVPKFDKKYKNFRTVLRKKKPRPVEEKKIGQSRSKPSNGMTVTGSRRCAKNQVTLANNPMALQKTATKAHWGTLDPCAGRPM